MNQVIGIIEWYFFPKAAAPIAFNRIIGPRLLGVPADEAAIAEAMPMGRTCFAELDDMLGEQALSHRRYREHRGYHARSTARPALVSAAKAAS